MQRPGRLVKRPTQGTPETLTAPPHYWKEPYIDSFSENRERPQSPISALPYPSLPEGKTDKNYGMRFFASLCRQGLTFRKTL
jgi:hypothetical protein